MNFTSKRFGTGSALAAIFQSHPKCDHANDKFISLKLQTCIIIRRPLTFFMPLTQAPFAKIIANLSGDLQIWPGLAIRNQLLQGGKGPVLQISRRTIDKMLRWLHALLLPRQPAPAHLERHV